MWRLWWKVKLISEDKDHSDDKINLLCFTHRLKHEIYKFEMDAQDIMEYDWNKKEYKNKLYKQIKNGK